MPSTLSPNMSLILPTVGQEPGPNWALDLNNSLSIIDQHNHAPGSGVQITSASININLDLPFNNNDAISLRSAKFQPQLSPLSGGLDIGCIYVSGQDLYYNDTFGNQIQITASGAVAGTPGSIGNLIAPAAVTYVPGTQSFVFESNQGNATPASLDGGNLYLRNILPSSNYVQIQPNPVLPASYSLTLPSALPVSTSALLVDSLGNIFTSGTANVFSAATLNASTANISTSLSIKNDTGLLEFKNTADNVQFASIVGSSVGLVLNLPDTADSYTFQVNGVTKNLVDNNGTDGQYLKTKSVGAISRISPPYVQDYITLINFNTLPGGTPLVIYTSPVLTTSTTFKDVCVIFEPVSVDFDNIDPQFSASLAIGYEIVVNGDVVGRNFSALWQPSTLMKVIPGANTTSYTLSVNVRTGGGGPITPGLVRRFRVILFEMG